jgi:hypothetical protein
MVSGAALFAYANSSSCCTGAWRLSHASESEDLEYQSQQTGSGALVEGYRVPAQRYVSAATAATAATAVGDFVPLDASEAQAEEALLIISAFKLESRSL